MKPRTLLSKGDKYRGKYVALKSFSSKTVIGSGTKPKTVLKAAQKKGVKEPVIFYVPEKDVKHIY